MQILVKLKNKYPTPRFLFLLSFAELWERFSYHGIRALLVLYLTLELGYDDVYSFSIYSLYAIISYGGTIIFGILADRYFGFFFLARSGAIINAFGHFFVTLSLLNEILLYYGIACIAFGTACFKGNIANLLSNCYSKHPEYSREFGFTYFYTFINIGGFIAYAFCGLISRFIGLSYCFSVVGLGMLIVIVIFLVYSEFFTKYDNSPKEANNPFILNFSAKKLFYLLSFVTLVILGTAFLKPNLLIKIINYLCFSSVIYYLYVIYIESGHRRRLIISTIFILSAASYYITAMQLGSFISLFLYRNVDRVILNFEIPVALCLSLYPASTIIVGLIATWMLKRYDLSKFIFSRLIVGILCTCLAFLTLYFSCLTASTNFKANIFGYILATFFIGIGEVLIMPVVIAQITNIIQKSRQGFIMGSLMMSLSFSNLIGFYISKLFAIDSVNITGFNIANSLKIYQEGFIKIVQLNLLFAFVIWLCAISFQKYLKYFKHNSYDNIESIHLSQ